ncbi:MAG: hypothetical protein J1G02_02955 [Clostridiales bacterium]|nr:hypothetical protein [Clostridiales bacterium]
MDIAIIIFMILVVALCAFTIYVVIRDFLRERRNTEIDEEEISEIVESKLEELEANRESQPVVAEQQPQEKPQEQPQEQHQEEYNGKRITVEEAVVAIPLEEYEGQIRFSADPKLSHKQKYNLLDSVQKAWYDDIVAYANQIDDIKSTLTNSHEEFKLYSKRVICLRIKKGTVICDFVIANTTFSRFISENKLSVKHAPTSFKLFEESDVGAAKECIDIAVRTIREEKEEAKRIQREKRRLARQAAQAAATTTDED